MTPQRMGRYLLFDRFAAGGMAEVHFGRLIGPARFSRLVAIKRIRAVFAQDPGVTSMLLDEARLSSRIRHPNVAQTLDVIQDAEDVCLVMEYIHGVPLSRLRALDAGPIEPRIAVAIVAAALHGLHAAHEAKSGEGEPLGIVHRDVSPQNILVGHDGVPRLIDFGIARALQREHVTSNGEVKGKLVYMAPEQLNGAPVTRQADLFAAGAVLWEALTGKPFCEGDNDANLIVNRLSLAVTPPGDHVPGLPESLDRAVLRSLSRAPRDRFATAEEMALALTSEIEPAPAADVARWIEGLAGDELEIRGELVRTIEAFVDTGARDATPIAGVAPPFSRRAVVASVVAAAGLAAYLGARTLFPPEAPRSVTSVSASVSATPRAPDLAGADRGVSSPPPALVVIAPIPSVSATSSASPPVPSAPSIKTPPKAPILAKPPDAGPAVDNCDPNFSFDANGHKHYKPECMP